MSQARLARARQDALPGQTVQVSLGSYFSVRVEGNEAGIARDIDRVRYGCGSVCAFDRFLSKPEKSYQTLQCVKVMAVGAKQI